MIGRVLFTGGARCGKSTSAEQLLRTYPDTTYVATSANSPDDDEWQRRVATHRARRPGTWHTLETDQLLAPIAAARPEQPVLVDCLTLWLMRRLDAYDAWLDPQGAFGPVSGEIESLTQAVARCAGGLVLVTNEVGSGIVPAEPGVRLFRDLLGRTNASVAAACDEVYLVVAGHRLRLEAPQGAEAP